MSGFTKLDSALTASSVWNEPDPVRIVWVTMLSLADKDGNVKGSIVGLAYLARKTLIETENALAVLQAPDPHSGRKEQDGRRVIAFEGGWHLVNHAFYRESGMSEETKAYWREKKRQQRAVSKNVSDSLGGLGYASGNGDASASEIYDAYPRKVGRPKALLAIRKALKTIKPLDLLKLTTLFAETTKAWPEADQKFIPHPSTWYNQERFNDDPSTWKRVTDSKAPVRRENINVPITRR